eukprot:6846285-Pyramimonas_sp.AAC.1
MRGGGKQETEKGGDERGTDRETTEASGTRPRRAGRDLVEEAGRLGHAPHAGRSADLPHLSAVRRARCGLLLVLVVPLVVLQPCAPPPPPPSHLLPHPATT